MCTACRGESSQCAQGAYKFFFGSSKPCIYFKLQLVPSKISFTFDAWTSEPGDPYLSVTGYQIDAPADAPKDWKLKTEQLAFKCIEGQHTGINMANILVDMVNRYEIRGKVSYLFLLSNYIFNSHFKVGWFTCDGAAVNGTTLHEFEKLLDERDQSWTAKEHDIL